MFPPRRGGALTPVLSPARRGAAVRMGRDGTARPPGTEWSSGVAAFLGGCHDQDIFKDPPNVTTTLAYYSGVYNKDKTSRPPSRII